MKSLLGLLRRSPHLAWLGASISLVGGIVTAFLLIRTQRLFVHPDTPHQLPLLLALLVGMLVCNLAAQIILQTLAGRALRELQIDLGAKVLHAPLRRLETVGAARLLSVQIHDAQAISGGIFVIPMLLSNAVVLFVCLGYLALRSLPLLAVLMAVVVVMVFLISLTGRAARRRDQRARHQADELIGQIHYTTEGAKELKMDGAELERFLEHGLGAAARKQEQVFLASSALHVLSSTVGRLFVFLAVIAVATAGAPLGVPTADVTTFGFVILYASTSLGFVIGSMPPLIRALVALDAVRQLGLELDAEPQMTQRSLDPGPTSLALRGVSHRYQREDGTAFVLGPLDFEARKNEVVFVVGGNGSGKSTLVKLFTGLYTPESGETFLAGERITPDLVRWYRDHFAVVFYDYALPLRVEIPSDQRTTELVASLGLSHVVRGGSFVPTEELSSGQRRRLALLLALLADRPVYVFDEWASDQDPTFKAYFYNTVLPELRARQKAVVVVSHDDRYYSAADRIVRLENGQTVDLPRDLPSQSPAVANPLGAS